MQNISFFNLSVLLIPLAVVAYYYYKYTNNKKDILIATARMVLQLVLIGYFLIVIFETKNIFMGGFILTFMLITASFIILRNTEDKSKKHYFYILIATFISAFIHINTMLYIVLELNVFYEPRYVIPIAGMVFTNIMNVISLAIERFEKELERGCSFEEAREISFKACMIPQINTLLAVGVVSLPGMMTGQILSGIDPLVAVRYQIMIMLIAVSSGGLSAIIYYYFKSKDILGNKKD